MSLVLGVGVVLTFAVLVDRLSLPDRAREGARVARDCLDILGDPELHDRDKEKRLQRRSIRLFQLLGILTGGSALALGVPLLAVWLLERTGVSSLASVLSTLQEPVFLLGTTVVGIFALLMIRRLGKA